MLVWWTWWFFWTNAWLPLLIGHCQWWQNYRISSLTWNRYCKQTTSRVREDNGEFSLDSFLPVVDELTRVNPSLSYRRVLKRDEQMSFQGFKSRRPWTTYGIISVVGLWLGWCVDTLSYWTLRKVTSERTRITPADQFARRAERSIGRRKRLFALLPCVQEQQISDSASELEWRDQSTTTIQWQHPNEKIDEYSGNCWTRFDNDETDEYSCPRDDLSTAVHGNQSITSLRSISIHHSTSGRIQDVPQSTPSATCKGEIVQLRRASASTIEVRSCAWPLSTRFSESSWRNIRLCIASIERDGLLRQTSGDLCLRSKTTNARHRRQFPRRDHRAW